MLPLSCAEFHVFADELLQELISMGRVSTMAGPAELSGSAAAAAKVKHILFLLIK